MFNVFGKELDVHFPTIALSSFAFIGLGAASIWAMKKTRCLFRSFFSWRRAYNNANRFLESKGKSKNGEEVTYSAVIFGCHTKVGQAYTRFLAEKGFNLILIERSKEAIDSVVEDLKLDNIKPKLLKSIVLDKFD